MGRLRVGQTPTSGRAPGLRARLGPLAAGLLAGGAALAVRHGLAGLPGKYGGLALWACGLYALVVLVAPRVGVARAFSWTVAISWAVELAQLTPGPAWLSSRHLVLRWVFGETFSVPDLPTYVAGAALSALVHAALSSRPSAGRR